MAEMKVEIGFNDIDSIVGLVDIVTRYIDRLQPEMRDELEQLCEQGAYDIGIDHIESLGLDPSKAVVVADGQRVSRPVSLNPIRRDYTAYDGEGPDMVRVKASSARLSVGDYVVCEW